MRTPPISAYELLGHLISVVCLSNRIGTRLDPFCEGPVPVTVAAGHYRPKVKLLRHKLNELGLPVQVALA